MSPFAGYANFDACVAAQMGSGKKKESALKICGYLMHKYEKGSESEKQATSMRETTDYYRFRPSGRSPEKYVRFRTKVLDSKKGIKAVIGFKQDGGSEIQSYLFSKEKWKPDDAKKWLKKYKLSKPEIKYKNGIIQLSSEVNKMDVDKKIEEGICKPIEKVPIAEKLEESKDDLVDISEEDLNKMTEEEVKLDEIKDDIIVEEAKIEETPVEKPVEMIEQSLDIDKRIEELSKKLEIINELSEELSKANVTIKEKTEQLSKITEERDVLLKSSERLSLDNKTIREQLESFSKVESERLLKIRNERIENLVDNQIKLGSVKKELREERLSALKNVSEEALNVIEESINVALGSRLKEPEMLTKKKQIVMEREPDISKMSKKEFFTGLAGFLESHKKY